MDFYDEMKVWIDDEVQEAEKTYSEVEDSLANLFKEEAAEEVVQEVVEIEAVEIPTESTPEEPTEKSNETEDFSEVLKRIEEIEKEM